MQMELVKGMNVLIRTGKYAGKTGTLLNQFKGDWLVQFDQANAGYIGNALVQILQGRQFYPVKDAPADTIIPQRSTDGSAGYDFHLPCDVVIKPRSSSKLIFTNVKCKIPNYEYLQLKIRSSISVKYHLALEGSGVIDPDYFENPKNDGNIGIQLRNDSNKWVRLTKGTRICQGIFKEFLITDDDAAFDKEARKGGFGSTGK